MDRRLSIVLAMGFAASSVGNVAFATLNKGLATEVEIANSRTAIATSQTAQAVAGWNKTIADLNRMNDTAADLLATIAGERLEMAKADNNLRACGAELQRRQEAMTP